MIDAREDLGYVASDAEINRRIRSYLSTPNSDSILEKALEVAFRDFAALGHGESFGVREIKRRLSEIRQTGYNLTPYSHMTKNQAWAYLCKVKRDLSERRNLAFR